MPTYTFSGGGAAVGFNMLQWGAGDIIGIVDSVFSSSRSSTQVTYSTGSDVLVAGGSFTGFDSNGDPTGGTISSFTHSTPRFGLPSMSVAASGFSLGVPTFLNWVITANVGALHHFMFDGADTMTGSVGPDILEGYGGGDAISGGSGSDILFGENAAGRDALTSAAGDDTLNGGDGDDVLYGQGGNDTLIGGNGTDTAAYSDALAAVAVSLAIATQQNTGGAGLDTLSGIENLEGSAFNDTLTGDGAANQINGGGGADAMAGAGGDDTYFVDSVGDTVSENLNEGVDQVRSTVSFSLGANIENLLLLGTDAINATGNALNNNLVGNTGANVFIGGGGDDAIDGGGGVDTLIFTGAGAGVTFSLAITAQQDTIGYGLYTVTGIENLTGSTFGDVLTGDAANNVIDGGTGADQMSGGAGDDTYIVDNAGDAVSESASQGLDIVYSSVTFNLGVNIENLTLTGSAAINGTGNALANVIVGNAGNNVLSGGGGSGVDIFVGGDGIDTLEFSASSVALQVDFSLGSAAEFTTGLVHSFSQMENATGSNFADIFIGGAGANYIFGGGGNDTFRGGGVGDIFDGGAGADQIVLNFANLSSNSTVATRDLIGNSGLTLLDGSVVQNMETFALTFGAGNDHLVIDTLLAGASSIAGGIGFDRITADFSYLTTRLDITSVDIQAQGFVLSYSSIEEYHITGGSGDDWLSGGSGNDVLRGGDGNDFISVNTTYSYGSSGADFIDGGAGNDTLNGVLGLTRVDGGSGVDRVGMLVDGGTTAYNITFSAHIELGDADIDNAETFYFGFGGGDDTLTLTADYFFGTNNTYDGGAGLHDRLVFDASGYSAAMSCGYARPYIPTSSLSFNGAMLQFMDSVEEFYITGGSGDDAIGGKSGNDVLNGGGGSDLIVGGAGNNIIHGGEGNDEVFGYDRLFTGSSSAGRNQLYGDGGNDVVSGGDGDDIVDGGDGDDTVGGGQGADQLFGGNGDDRIYFDGADTIISGGAGYDIAYVAWQAVGNLNLTLGQIEAAVGADYFGSGYADDILTASGATWSVDIRGGQGNDQLTGGLLGDFLDGGIGADTMIGGDGDDTYIVDDAGDVTSETSALGGTDTVRSSVTRTLGANLENLVLTGGAANGTGNGLANVITGNGANNILDGGAGADTMIGGLGDDTYYVDNAGDVVTENASEGTDTVRSAVGIAALAANVENLILLGSAATGNGNSLNNTITGNAANNSINGGAGADTMIGGLGNDTYFVDNAGDVITELSGQGTDTVFSSINVTTLWQNVENLTLSGAALSVNGNALNNILTGNSQKNTLNGGAGEDTLIGGLDSDTYIYNSLGDVITENLNEGLNDAVIAFIDVAALMANVENVTLAGTAISATGNDLSNILTGNSLDNFLYGGLGNDQLNGAVGADTMTGGQGDDAYLVENLGDVVIEASGEGNDVIYAWVNIAALADNVERATIIGAGNLNITGNALNNRLNGNDNNNTLVGLDGEDIIGGLAGADVIIGGAGRDLLTGGTGADTFVYQALSDSGVTGSSRDIIYDFVQGQDLIDLVAIDAISGGGDDAFNFIGNSAFSNTAGELRYEVSGGYTIISLDVNGDGIADSQITLVGNVPLTSADFGL